MARFKIFKIFDYFVDPDTGIELDAVICFAVWEGNICHGIFGTIKEAEDCIGEILDVEKATAHRYENQLNKLKENEERHRNEIAKIQKMREERYQVFLANNRSKPMLG